jgi:thiamine-phosphate pyrophosphorylase
LLELGDAAVAMGQPHGARIIVNDRVDVGLMAGAAGVHLGQDDLPPADSRRLLGPDGIIGFSTHSVAQVEIAMREPISYIAVGPVFGTPTKHTGYDAVGLELVSAAARLAGGVPVVAIGGITLETAESVLAAGATAVAVIGDLLIDRHPGARVAAYLRALARHRV